MCGMSRRNRNSECGRIVVGHRQSLHPYGRGCAALPDGKRQSAERTRPSSRLGLMLDPPAVRIHGRVWPPLALADKPSSGTLFRSTHPWHQAVPLQGEQIEPLRAPGRADCNVEPGAMSTSRSRVDMNDVSLACRMPALLRDAGMAHVGESSCDMGGRMPPRRGDGPQCRSLLSPSRGFAGCVFANPGLFALGYCLSPLPGLRRVGCGARDVVHCVRPSWPQHA